MPSLGYQPAGVGTVLSSVSTQVPWREEGIELEELLAVEAVVVVVEAVVVLAAGVVVVVVAEKQFAPEKP